jgi:hypothetical protein
MSLERKGDGEEFCRIRYGGTTANVHTISHLYNVGKFSNYTKTL